MPTHFRPPTALLNSCHPVLPPVISTQPGWRDAAGVAALADSLGPDVAGKVLVDATNPLSAFPDLEVLWNGTSGVWLVCCRAALAYTNAWLVQLHCSCPMTGARSQRCCQVSRYGTCSRASQPTLLFVLYCALCDVATGGELLAAGIPSAHVYKAFNTIGTTVMEAVEDMGYPVQL